jgi:1,4-dihydroxy-2-naphthoate octaprenyltransferase
VYDAEKSADTAERHGPPRVVSSGLMTPRTVKRGMIVAFALASMAGIYLTLEAGVLVILTGVVSIACGVAYTRGPRALAYVGLGDVFAFAFFGIVAVVGTVFVQTHSIGVREVVAAIPIGALATVLLVINNIRDRHGDRRAGKQTWVVRFGRRFAETEIATLLVVAELVPIVLVAFRSLPNMALLSLATTPFAVGLWAEVRASDGRALNRTLAGACALLIAFAFLYAGGLVW